ncbi:ankyrin repeat-containing domain protein [Aspergillus crustosus]
MSLTDLPDDLLLRSSPTTSPPKSTLVLSSAQIHSYTNSGNHLCTASTQRNTTAMSSPWAIETKRLDILEYALEHVAANIDTNSPNHHGATPFIIASTAGYLKAMEILLPKGASVKACNVYHETTLSLAAQEGELPVIDVLLNHADIKPDQADTMHQTPFWWACSENRLGIVTSLMKRADVDINKARFDGVTPPLAATTANHSAIVEYMLLGDEWSDPNKGDDGGLTPLMSATLRGHGEIVRLLLACPRIDIAVTNKRGETALSVAARSKHVDILQQILDHGAGVNGQDESGQSVLSSAAGVGLERNVSLLLERGADPTIPDSRGWVPLHWAVQDGHAAIVEVLLRDPRVNPARASGVGTTPLHCASWDGHYDVLVLLLAREDIDVNCHDNAGWTPFIWAAFNGNPRFL